MTEQSFELVLCRPVPERVALVMLAGVRSGKRDTTSAGMRAAPIQITFKTMPVCHNKFQRARSIFTCVHALVDALILAAL